MPGQTSAKRLTFPGERFATLDAPPLAIACAGDCYCRVERCRSGHGHQGGPSDIRQAQPRELHLDEVEIVLYRGEVVAGLVGLAQLEGHFVWHALGMTEVDCSIPTACFQAVPPSAD